MTRLLPLVVASAVLALPAVGVADAPAPAVAPHASWAVLPWTNGHSSAAYDTVRRRVTSWREHLYARRDENTVTRDLAYDLYFGLRSGGQNAWLTARPLDDAGWDGKAGIARVVQRHGDLRATQYYFSPFAIGAPVVIAVVEVENVGSAATTDAALFALGNLHVGGGDDGALGERIQWTGGAFEERGARGLVLHRPLPAPTRHAASPDNPYVLVSGGGRLVDTADSGTRDDAVAGFEWDLAGLAPGERRRFAVTWAFSPTGDRAALDAALAPAGATADALLDGARADWDAFFARTRAPEHLSPVERAIYDRQLAVLRMAQVREPGRGHGQILASLPPGMWNIAWVRDQAYATWAMIAAGMDEEAHDALAFLLGAQASTYVCCDRDGGPWVGAPYAISVTRYYGNGVEESDWNAQGPNIEFDGFGLTLATLADYVDATGDLSLITANDAAIFERTADVLLGLIETGGAADGLIRADSSIWETHWYDGGRQHFAYTQATAVHGLRAAARLAEHLGRTEDAIHYRTRAEALATAAVARLVDPATQVVRQSLEQSTRSLDAAAITFVLWDLVPADGAVAAATLAAFDQGLWNGVTGHGYRRNDDGGDYDLREWVVVDLWIAEAKRRAGRVAEADALVAWITDQAVLNFELIPENYDRTTADYQGEVPMVGFGAGAYVTALWQRGGGTGPGDVDAGTGDAGMIDETQPGGCCSTGGPADASPLLLLAYALMRRRRRAAPRTGSAAAPA